MKPTFFIQGSLQGEHCMLLKEEDKREHGLSFQLEKQERKKAPRTIIRDRKALRLTVYFDSRTASPTALATSVGLLNVSLGNFWSTSSTCCDSCFTYLTRSSLLTG